MLCQLVEDGVVKCERYWPQDSVTRLYADISVTMTHSTSYANFIVRTFSLVNDSDEHHVTQYQFTVWPEHGVPRDPLALLEFHNKVSSGPAALRAPHSTRISGTQGRSKYG